MNATSWECIDEVLTSKMYEITDYGPLHGPIRSFSITRDADLQLVLESISDGASVSSSPIYPAGTVRTSTDTIKFSGVLIGGGAVALGITQYKLSSSMSPRLSDSIKKETSRLH
jgi:hypothetical protein